MVSRLALVAAAAVAASSAYGYDYSSEPSYATTTSMYEAPAYTTSSSYGYEPASSSYYEEPSYTSSSEYAAPAYTDASYEPSYDNKMRKSYKKHYGDNYKKQYDEPAATYEDPDEAELAYYMKKDYQPAAETKTCNKGDLQCCNSVQSAKSTDFSKVLSSDVYSVIPDMMAGSNAPVGLTCSPLIQSLSGGVQCNQQTVCCDGGHFSGLISINCIAFNPGSQAAGII